ncbi:hypothetical protein Ntsu_49590 [Nocardia sp. IFM 10818]
MRRFHRSDAPGPRRRTYGRRRRLQRDRMRHNGDRTRQADARKTPPAVQTGSVSPGELAGLPAYFAGAVKGWLIVVKYCTAAMIATGAVTKI